MIWRLSADISFCELDGRLFFLDIQRDRYFQLSNALEQRFVNYLEAPDGHDADVSALVEHNLLSQTTALPCCEVTTDITLPSQSTLETPCSDVHISLDMVWDVFTIVAMMHWQLKVRRLKPILQALNDYRYAKTSHPIEGNDGFQRHLSKIATAFNRVRPYVPIETCCLIDSLSMVKFLAKHGMHVRLVIGVARDPFSAHAWAQHGALVLNETVGTAQAHVPIRVV